MSRGHTVKTPERVALAMDLRREGWLLREIAAHFGVAWQTIDSWLRDPYGIDQAKRRERSAKRCAGTCVDCGTPTDGSRGRALAPERCPSCAPKERAIWTRAAIVLAMQEWAAEHGEPPAMADWGAYQASVEHNNPGRAERFLAERDRWPWATSVVYVFGRWNEAIRAAGFEPRDPVGSAANQTRRRSANGRASC